MSGNPSIEDRDELDRRVRAIRWDDKAVEFGSPQRCRVAAMMVESGLVGGRLRRVFPSRDQWEAMTEYTTTKIAEKIIGVGLGSKTGQWNWDGLWNPREESSFSGWVRQLAYTVARTNARRVLHSAHELSASRFEDEDGYNPVWDDKASTPLNAGTETGGPFDTVPGLTVPRPIGADRRLLTRILTDSGAEAMADRARTMGWWHRTLDGLDAGVCAALLLQPVSRRLKGVLPRMLPDMADVAGLYEATQMSSDPRDVAPLRRAVAREARRLGCVEWDVWCRLGTAAWRHARSSPCTHLRARCSPGPRPL